MPKHEMMMWVLAGGGTLAGASLTYLATRPGIAPATSVVRSGLRRVRSALPAVFSVRGRRRDGGPVATAAQRAGLQPTGSAAFDEYRDQQIARLEHEAEEFRSFLNGLREARDRQEFDQFLRERKGSAPA